MGLWGTAGTIVVCPVYNGADSLRDGDHGESLGRTIKVVDGCCIFKFIQKVDVEVTHWPMDNAHR